MRTLLAIVVLMFSLNSFASDLFIQIRNEVAPLSTEKGQLFLKSYVYALVTASSVEKELSFDGDGNEVVKILEEAFKKDDITLAVAGAGYVASKDRIDLILIQKSCLEIRDFSDDCFFTTSLNRRD